MKLEKETSIFLQFLREKREKEAAMLWETIDRFFKMHLIKRNRRLLLVGIVYSIVFIVTGCSTNDKLPKVLDIRVTATNNKNFAVSNTNEIIADNEICFLEKDDSIDAENIAAIYCDIYKEAVRTNTLGSLETKKRIIVRLGENGYVAVDNENQVDWQGQNRQ